MDCDMHRPRKVQVKHYERKNKPSFYTIRIIDDKNNQINLYIDEDQYPSFLSTFEQHTQQPTYVETED